MHEAGQLIFSAETLRIEFFAAGHSSPRLLISFTEANNRELDGPGFGGKFAVEKGFDVIAVKSCVDDWYQSFPPEALNRIREFISERSEPYRWRATYGSSMGGYAALNFGSCFEADAAVAFSPQFDITAEWERRWSAQADAIGQMHTLSERFVRPECRYIIFYDPADNDLLHFNEFRRVIPQCILSGVPVRYAGHPVGYYLSSTGALKEVVSAALSGEVASAALRRAREYRSDYPPYFFNLAGHCLKRRHLQWALSAIERALSLKPIDPEFHMRASRICEARGDLNRAVYHAATAVALSPSHPHMVAMLSLLLFRRGLLKQALHYIDQAVVLLPASKAFVEQREAILARLGTP
ncbi:YqiA/YcfP family alpha/beta fold hydrolase [Methylobacterium nigriterrae]|uniref:YqiA/YcfP family alpha/beta fold hydrolase n=1 Tax=Methylobacterium nigriterrae TaxID=3127512 RepID=UPI0030134E3D